MNHNANIYYVTPIKKRIATPQVENRCFSAMLPGHHWDSGNMTACCSLCVLRRNSRQRQGDLSISHLTNRAWAKALSKEFLLVCTPKAEVFCGIDTSLTGILPLGHASFIFSTNEKPEKRCLTVSGVLRSICVCRVKHLMVLAAWGSFGMCKFSLHIDLYQSFWSCTMHSLDKGAQEEEFLSPWPVERWTSTALCRGSWSKVDKGKKRWPMELQ